MEKDFYQTIVELTKKSEKQISNNIATITRIKQVIESAANRGEYHAEYNIGNAQDANCSIEYVLDYFLDLDFKVTTVDVKDKVSMIKINWRQD